ncbi:glycosyltransferase family 4 protein [Zhongshania sp.]|jgi:glycosyltransferase involved in cell wall biosynthesis|uniref:glycosyltransferase family 4 protein n=1 Tax=Zhongshania sp. TaxID=1971902 RepID=UPI0039E2B469
MPSDPANIVSPSPMELVKASVTPLSDVRSRRALSVCLLGYRSAPYGGGQGIYLKYLSKALVEAGHQVDVISGQPYPHLDPRVNLIRMPGMNLFETGLGSIRPHHLRSLTNIYEWTGKLTGAFSEPYCFGRRVLKYLKQHGRHYDIIHDNQCLSYGMLDLQKQGFPLITTIHHPITSDLSIALSAAKSWTERLMIRRWHSFLIMQRRVARELHHVVTVSERSRTDIAAAFNIQPAGISLVHCGIDTEEFRPLEHIVKNPNRIMATVSSDQPLKGMRYLLEAVAAVIPRYPDLELLLVGTPKEDGESGRLIRELGLSKHIRAVSGISTEDLVKYYNEASVVVVPSIYEGFGLPAGEAMACGTALISTDGGALPEVVGDAAIQVPIRDSKAIAEVLDTLLASPAWRDELAAAGRARIEELFCWKRAAQQMTNYYWQVIQRENG